MSREHNAASAAPGLDKPDRSETASSCSSASAPPAGSEALLQVEDLTLTIDALPSDGPLIDRVSFRVSPGRTLALVGESGCGKSLTALSILRLIPRPPFTFTGGRVLWREPNCGDARDLLRLDERSMVRIRGGRIGMIFQEPLTSLHPLKSMGRQMLEGINLHQGIRGRAARALAAQWFERVGLSEPARRLDQFPHQLSGGMLQRAMIAMALSAGPALLIADEPTTALDVSVQAGILELLETVQAQTGMGMLLITHDLGVVGRVAHDVAVMYAGRIVEFGPVGDVLSAPAHPYTQALIGCVPRLHGPRRPLITIPGRVPQPRDYLQGCRFTPRCTLAANRAQAAFQQGRSAQVTTLPDGQAVPTRCVQGDGSAVAPPLSPLLTGHCVACWEAMRTPA